MTIILDKIITRVYDRRARCPTHEVSELPMDVKEPTIFGTYSVFRMTSGNRYIDRKQSIQIDGVKETPPALSRDYLYATYGHGQLARADQHKIIDGNKKTAPYWTIPCEFSDGLYVDIKSAYWSIMNCAGWDVDYNPPNWIGDGQPPRDFPWPDHKIARNSLVSAGASAPMVITHPDNTRTPLTSRNGLKNSQLICLISDVFHSIANFAVGQGAVYVNADGYILTDERAADNVMNEIREWGLESSVRRRGAGRVYAVGVYQVGTYKSKVLSYRQQYVGCPPLCNIYAPDYARWLKQSFSKLAY